MDPSLEGFIDPVFPIRKNMKIGVPTDPNFYGFPDPDSGGFIDPDSDPFPGPGKRVQLGPRFGPVFRIRKNGKIGGSNGPVFWTPFFWKNGPGKTGPFDPPENGFSRPRFRRVKQTQLLRVQIGRAHV